MTDLEKIQFELDQLSTAYTQNTGKLIACPPELKVGGYRTELVIYTRAIESKFRSVFNGDALEDMLEKAHSHIDNLPSEEEANLKEFQLALASLLDMGRENNIAADFTNPLRKLSEKLSENLITHQL